jgi:hypothetical protein
MALYPSIRIEGGLLGPDILDRLTAGELPGQCAADFRLDGLRNLTDEIAAAFADARSLWGVFQHRLERVPEDDMATSVTRDAWVIPFLGLLGYELRFNQRAFEVDGLTFAISHRAGEPDESPPVHIVGIRQELGRVAASGRPRLAPHSLVQEYLNRTEHLWGVVTNGQTLRLLRDCTFVRRQAYVEFDLPAILDEQRFQDFAALYRLVHRTRLPRTAEDAGDCLLEKYYLHSIEQGGRVRDHLRDGVEQCLVRLANGFLRHTANDELRRRVAASADDNERITPERLYRQLLILVYRFLFLLVSEDRGLLSADPLYRDHYSIGRLRRLLDNRAAFTDHDDLWQSLRVLWLLLIKDQPQPALNNQPMAAALGLPVLNGDLFAPQDLDSFTISNRDLLDAFWRLAWYQENTNSPPRRVNYAALDVEELGSVYESLLEFHPAIEVDHARRTVFSFVAGSERRTTGSYYTPPELVAELIKSALEPVLEDRLNACAGNDAKEKAILSIRVCDPACGSGHFLLAAARRLGKELARVRTGEDEPAPERLREATRDCIAHCIYGVDKNPLAVDLCRVALWLEGHTADKPLTFLDHRIRCGDSLVGVFDLDVLKLGIPDDAFKPLTGDDKNTAKRLKAANRAERRDLESGQRTFQFDPSDTLDTWTRHSRELDEIADDSPEAIRRKKQLYDTIRHSPLAIRQRQACDLWTAAFFQPLKPQMPPITTAVLADHLSRRPIDPRALGPAEALAVRNRFFHWPLEFPEVFADGGFDVVLGNPPWEHIELKEKEWFATKDQRIVQAQTGSQRKRLIEALANTNPSLYVEFQHAKKAHDALGQFLRLSQRFSRSARGRINTYTVFAELMRSVIGPSGRVGCIVPSGIATDDTTKFFFQDLIESRSLASLYDFENRKAIFPGVHRSYKFCLLTLRGANSEWRMANGSKARSKRESDRTSDQPPFARHHSPGGGAAQFTFFLHDTAELKDPDRVFSLSPDDIALLNPNTRTCPSTEAWSNGCESDPPWTGSATGWSPRPRAP